MIEPDITRRRLLKSGSIALGTPGLLGTASGHDDGAHPVPEVAEGFRIRPFAPLRLPTALAFGPGADGTPDLYATSIPRSGYEPSAANEVGAGLVWRVRVEYTATGPVATDVTTAVDGLNVPLGIAFRDGEMYVADKHSNANVPRENGVVYHVANDGSTAPILDGLPLGAHDTNHIEVGPDGRLYVANGSSTCNGQSLGPQEVHPYNGSILAVDPQARKDDPADLEWVDENGDPIEPHAPEPHVNTAIATHPVNDDFNSKVEVMAQGFRNIFGIAFSPDGTAYTGMNGSQNPASQDVFYRLDAFGEDHALATGEFGPDYGFPFFLNRTKGEGEGTGGETGDQVVLEPNSVYADIADAPTDPADYVAGDGLMGWHVCATGLDFPTGGQFAFPTEWTGDAFIGECGAFEVQKALQRTVESRDTRNTGHKVTHVYTDASGQPTAFRDFVTGLSLPTDVQFGPRGAMYIADADFGVYVVQPAPQREQLPLS